MGKKLFWVFKETKTFILGVLKYISRSRNTLQPIRKKCIF